MANYIEIYTTHVQRGINDIQHRQYFHDGQNSRKKIPFTKKEHLQELIVDCLYTVKRGSKILYES